MCRHPKTAKVIVIDQEGEEKTIQKCSDAIKAIRVYGLIMYFHVKIPDRRKKCESNRIENKQQIITNIIA